MELKLNIYKGKDIEKTYTTDTYDLLFGTLEDILSIVDGVKTDNTDDIINVVSGGISKLKPFLRDIFDGLTEEEIRRTKVKELIPLFIDVFKYAFSEIKGISTGKN